MAKQSINRLPIPHFIPRYRVTLVSEGGHTAPYGVLRDSAAAAAALRPCFAGLDREQFLPQLPQFGHRGVFFRPLRLRNPAID